MMRRNSIVGMDVFLAVARHLTFCGAASELGIRPSAVSQQLKALEQQLGVSLFVRTTRSVRLTEEGERLLTRADPAMTELLSALEDVRELANTPSGVLKVTLPEVALRMIVEPALAGFQKAYPRILLELSIDDGFVDIVSAGFHAGIRRGHQVHEDMIAIPLTPPLRDAFFASPDYLNRNGYPRKLSDLDTHSCILYRYIASKRLEQWRVKNGDRETEINVQESMIVNDARFLIDAARNGLGIASFYRQTVEKYVENGELILLFEELCTEYPGFSFYFPKSYRNLKRLRVFKDWLTAHRFPE